MRGKTVEYRERTETKVYNLANVLKIITWIKY